MGFYDETSLCRTRREFKLPCRDCIYYKTSYCKQNRKQRRTENGNQEERRTEQEL